MWNDQLTRKDTTFKVEMRYSHCLSVPSIYSSGRWVKCMHHMSVADCVIHFWRKRLPGPEWFRRVDFNARQGVRIGHAGFTNVADNMSRPSPNEIIRDCEYSEYRRRQMERREREVFSLMNALEIQISKPRQPVLDPSSSTLTTRRFCLLVDKHRHLVGYDKDFWVLG